ncbi:MAG: single-stranded-DNA-specific exonuclease RecJ [Clostridia bacterium]|nr:single-stranded-DNA-specific exonuclease RecJ [Clostridia bacterium]
MKVWMLPEKKDFSKEEILNSGVSPLLIDILSSRNFESMSDIKKFLDCDYSFSDSSKFCGMPELVSRLNKAIEKFEKICVFGDYDCDGITATVMFYSYLLKKNLDVIYMLPSRYEEGYGLTKNVIDEIHNYGVNLIITVDNGISAYDEILYAKELGIDTIITDHHKIPEKLPPAVAIVNPYLNKDGFKDFAGVGVVFKILQELEKDNISPEDLIKEYGDLLAIGTIGDMVPLIDENRLMISKAFKYFSYSKRPGVRVLMEGSVFNNQMNGNEVSFGIVPKLNACGRMGSAETAAQLLLSASLDEARSFLQIALKMNDDRKNLCKSVLEEVELEIFKNNLDDERVIFAWSKKWNHGVVGIAASVICNKFGKPCFLFAIKKNEVRGSARSIEGFDIHEYLSKCKDLIDKFGGHTLAAGANLKLENLEAFKKKFLGLANSSDMPFYNLKIDYIINPSDISVETVDEIQRIAPFGNANNEPIFGIMGVELTKVFPIGGGKHIKVCFKSGEEMFDGTMFGMTINEFMFSPGDILDIAMRIKRNCFSGFESAVIHVVDVKYSLIDTLEFAKEQRIFEDFMSGISSLPEDCVPTRDDFERIFKFIKSNSLFAFRVEKIYLSLDEPKIRIAKILIILKIFDELEIFKIKKRGDNYKIAINSGKKANLNESKILKRASGQ